MRVGALLNTVCSSAKSGSGLCHPFVCRPEMVVTRRVGRSGKVAENGPSHLLCIELFDHSLFVKPQELGAGPRAEAVVDVGPLCVDDPCT